MKPKIRYVVFKFDIGVDRELVVEFHRLVVPVISSQGKKMWWKVCTNLNDDYCYTAGNPSATYAIWLSHEKLSEYH